MICPAGVGPPKENRKPARGFGNLSGPWTEGAAAGRFVLSAVPLPSRGIAMKVIVRGAGVIGRTPAYYLNRLGCEVTVVDRQAAPAAETSFANGGQVSVSHAEPWANPGAPLKVLKWLAREDAPLLFRLKPSLRQWIWGLSFLRECTPARTRRNIEQIVRLGTFSREKLQELRAATGIQYDQRESGILHFYTDAKEFDAALGPAEQMRALGCERRGVSAGGAGEIEAALRDAKGRLARAR